MEDRFDAFEYVRFLQERWKLVGTACAVAVVLAVSISLVLPKQYTATASLLIEAPAGNDPRTATAVSPIYLESLKTYEHFAMSDSLFQRALERLQIRDEGGGLKRRALKVTKVRDTRILQINATLTDPVQAQALAQFVAEETMSLSRSVGQQSEGDLAEEHRKQLEAAKARLAQAERSASDGIVREPVDAVEDELNAALTARTSVSRDLVDNAGDVAGFASQEKITQGLELDRARRELAAARARGESLRIELERLDRKVATTEGLLAVRKAHRDLRDAEARSARSAFETANTRYNEMRASVGFRGERLKIIDPGIVPRRPSFPRVVLNGVAAFGAALIASMLWLTVLYASFRQRLLIDEPAGRHILDAEPVRFKDRDVVR